MLARCAGPAPYHHRPTIGDDVDLRDFIAQCERHGDLKRVTAEVDWNLEMSHIAKLMEERDGPAVLFENVKDHPDSGRVLFGAYSNTRRLATVLGRPVDLSMVDLSYEWMRLSVGEVIRAKEVATGPVFENTIEEDDVDILRQIPSPKFYERTAAGTSAPPASWW